MQKPSPTPIPERVAAHKSIVRGRILAARRARTPVQRPATSKDLRGNIMFPELPTTANGHAAG